MAGRFGRLGILFPSENASALGSNEGASALSSTLERQLLKSPRNPGSRSEQGAAGKSADDSWLTAPEPQQSTKSGRSTLPESFVPAPKKTQNDTFLVNCDSLGPADCCDGAKITSGDPKMATDEDSASPQSDDYVDHGTGCLNCGADDDHANLLLCEACNDEYHTYCLGMKSVPEGDFYCDACKPFHSHAQADDGLNDLVGVLSPTFTSRFGQIVWAAGGVGFGWWPACIYDPRLTVGAARSLARNHLGKKHLVYFFECLDAPFTVLGNTKLISWEDGLLEEYDLGRTARASGKNKSAMFDKALVTALVEVEKPLDMRMEWNHPKESLLTSRSEKPVAVKSERPPVAVKSEKPPVAVKSEEPPVTVKHDVGIVSNQDSSSARKKQKKTHEESVTNRSSVTRSGRNIKSASADIIASNEEYRALSAALALSKAEAEKGNPSRNESHETVHRRPHSVSNRKNLSEATRALSCPVVGGAIEIEPAEDGQLFCKVLRRFPTVHSTDEEDRNTAAWPVVADASVNVGFITLASRRNATFADARRGMLDFLDEDCLPASSKWRFYVPKLGPVSLKQENNLGPLLEFLLSTTSDCRLGEGTSRNPLKVIVTEI